MTVRVMFPAYQLSLLNARVGLAHRYRFDFDFDFVIPNTYLRSAFDKYPAFAGMEGGGRVPRMVREVFIPNGHQHTVGSMWSQVCKQPTVNCQLPALNFYTDALTFFPFLSFPFLSLYFYSLHSLHASLSYPSFFLCATGSQSHLLRLLCSAQSSPREGAPNHHLSRRNGTSQPFGFFPLLPGSILPPFVCLSVFLPLVILLSHLLWPLWSNKHRWFTSPWRVVLENDLHSRL